jgi:hypothetical protein
MTAAANHLTPRRAAPANGKDYEPHQTMLESLLATAAEGQPLPLLNVDEIDSCCNEFASAERLLDSAQAVYDIAKRALIAVVKEHGTVPPGADESRRVLGRRNQATITIGKVTTVREDGVREIEDYLTNIGLPTVFDRLFATNTKHTLHKSAHEVLAALQLRKPEQEKVASLYGRCIDVKPKAPSLRVDIVTAEKPVRTPRAEKAVA